MFLAQFPVLLCILLARSFQVTHTYQTTSIRGTVRRYTHFTRSLGSIENRLRYNEYVALKLASQSLNNRRIIPHCQSMLQGSAADTSTEVPISSKCKPLKVIIAGAPASGKGTQCEYIKNKFGVVHLSTGDMLRAAVQGKTELGLMAKDFMDAGQLVPDELIINVIVDRLKQKDCIENGWLLDGFPRTRSQADALNEAGMVPDHFLLLDVNEDILVERVTGRRTDPVTGAIYHMSFKPPPEEITDRLVQRSDDTADKIKLRYKEFQSHIDAITSCYDKKMTVINGAQGTGEVTQSIEVALAMSALPSVPPTSNLVSSPAVAPSVPQDNPAVVDKDETIGKVKATLGMAMLIIADKVLRKLFVNKGIAFPSSLAGMVLFFAAMTGSNQIAPATTDIIFYSLSHSVAFIKAWLPLFFVPPLAVLPLKLYLVRGFELPLVGLLLIGSLGSLSSAGLLAKALSVSGKAADAKKDSFNVVEAAPACPLPGFRVPFAVSAVSCIAAAVAPAGAGYLPIVQKAFEISSTVSGYVLGTKLPAQVRKLFHPVIACTIYTISTLALFSSVAGKTLSSTLSGYYGAVPGTGSGDLIASLLGPAILSFGLQLYQYRDMLVKKAPVVTITTGCSALFGLVSSAFLSRLAKLRPAETAFAPLTRCITSPLALAGAKLTGADPSLAAFLVVITGIMGASFGEAWLKTIGVEDEVSVGLALGAGAHGLGAASVSSNALKFAAAVVSFSLTGMWTVALLSYPPLKNKLMKITLSPALPV